MRSLSLIFLLFLISFRSFGSELGAEVKKETLILVTEGKALKQVNKLLKKYKGKPIEGDLLLRKSDLFTRRSKSSQYFEVFKEDNGVDFLGKLRKKKVSFVGEQGRGASQWLKKSVRILKQIERKFPNHPKSDFVLFKSGFQLQQLGKSKSALNQYEKLVKKFPQSSLLADALLASGEIHYDDGKFNQAIKYYDEVIGIKNSPVLSLALYKRAWAFYNLRMTNEALKSLEDLIVADQKNQGNSRASLVSEARYDMALFYTEGKDPNQANEYFTKWGGKDFLKHVYRLGQLYLHYNHPEKMLTVFDESIENHVAGSPVSEPLTRIFVGVVQENEKLRKLDRAHSHLEGFAKACAAKAKCESSLMKVALKSAVWRHKGLKKVTSNHSKSISSEAEGAYTIYLERQADVPEKQKVRNQYAELLFLLGKFAKASRQYEIVSKKATDPNFVHDSSYAALLSFEKSIDEEEWDNETADRFNLLSGNYVSKNPKGKYFRDVLYRQAQMLLKGKKITEAVEAFRKLGSEKESHKKILMAQDSYIELQNERKMYKGLIATLPLWIENAKTKERKEHFRSITIKTRFLFVQRSEKDGKLKESMTGYTEFSKEFPKHPLASQAWWNAILIAKQLGDNVVVSEMGEKMQTLFPQSEHRVEAMKLAISVSEKLGQLERAAGLMEKMSGVDPKGESWKMMAGDTFLHAGIEKKAAALFLELSKSKISEIRAEAWRKWISLEVETTPSDEILSQISKDSDGKIRAIADSYRAKNFLNKKNYKKAFESAKSVIRKKGLDDETWSRARWVQAQVLEKEYLDQSLRTRKVERISLLLQMKIEKLRKAQSAYQSVIRRSDTTQAVLGLEKLGLLIDDFLNQIKKFPFPKNITAEERKILSAEFDKMVLPLEDQAVDNLEKALKLAKSGKVFGKIPSRIQGHIRRLNFQEKLKVPETVSLPSPLVPRMEPVI